jgi:hypothetical protein
MTIVTIGVVGYILYVTGRKILTECLLRRDAIQTRAIIIDEENYIGSKPLSPNRSYSYCFYVNGESYTNDSKDPKLQVGDSIDIEYVRYWPSLNRRISGSN